MQVGGVILCGGHSQRMGFPKALLPFGSKTMLQHVVSLLAPIVNPLVVVAARDQELPSLPPAVQVTYDNAPDRGPLEGMHAGLQAMQGHAEAAYLTSCDVPLLVPAFVETLIDNLGTRQAVVPVDQRFHHPLAAVYRVELVTRIRALLDADQLRPFFLLEQSDTLRIPVEQLREIDPDLKTLQNINHPQDYLAALAACQLTAPAHLLSLWQDQLDS